MTDSTTPSLIDLSPSTIAIIKRIALVLAIVAVAVLVAGRRFGWFDYRPGGASFDGFINPIFVGLFILATVVALKWEIVGGALAAFVVALLAVAGVLSLLIALGELSRRTALVGIGAVTVTVTVTAILGFFVGSAIYDHFWGPTHPSSTVAAPPDSPVEWVWTGAVTTSSAEVRAQPDDDYDSSTRPDPPSGRS